MNSENSKKNTIRSKKHLTNSSKNSNQFDDEENSNESSIRKLFRKKTKKSTNNKDKIEEENFENETNKINNKPLLTDINTQDKTKAKTNRGDGYPFRLQRLQAFWYTAVQVFQKCRLSNHSRRFFRLSLQ